MSKFITYEYDSGEIVFIKRAEIGSFHPVYNHPKGYNVYVTVGKETYVIHKAETLEDAKAWIEDQILAIDIGTDGVPDTSGVTAEELAETEKNITKEFKEKYGEKGEKFK